MKQRYINEKLLKLKYNSIDKMQKARDLINTCDYTDSQEPLNLLNDAFEEISECLENEEYIDDFGLIDLQKDIIDLKATLENPNNGINIDKEYDEIIKRKSKDKLILITKDQFHVDFNTENLVFTLIKEDNGVIRVYYKEEAMGMFVMML